MRKIQASYVVLSFYFLFIAIVTFGEEKSYTTNQVQEAPIIDGYLVEEVWSKVNWGTDFVQYEPHDGEAPSQETAFKVLYNSNSIFVAIRAFDNFPDSIVKRVARRDQLDGDFVGIQFDSYNDNRTAFIFAVNSVGVIWDGLCINDGDIWDDTWDPLWTVKTNIDDLGWTAEMEIPLSQLRFGNSDEYTWGLQVVRNHYRQGEVSTWQYIPRDASGWVHLFGTLHGIKDIEPQKQVELLPYFVGQHERYSKEEGNPFSKGKESKLVFGIDGKVGVTNDLTLNLTVNPDFGQVEADPSEVNLSAFESYFEEKRPFFVEGKNILDFQITMGDGGFAQDNLFYSRRIGRQPHHYPDIDEGYVNMPDNTNILSAVKLTGKTQNGLSIGILESVTAIEKAEISINEEEYEKGNTQFETVEPLTNYFVSRIQKDANEGNTIFGGMITSTRRYLNDDQLDFLHKDAITGGFDFHQQWKDKTYYLKINTIFSNVRGSELAIYETQTSSGRYFQRPDARYLKLDSSLTALTGHGGTINFGKGGNGNLKFYTLLTWRSPSLELNDIGFLRSADWIMEVIWMQYSLLEPFSIFRDVRVNFNQWSGWDFGGVNIFNGGNVNFNTQLKNYWRISSGANVSGRSISNSDLRGGPSLFNEGGFNNWFNIRSDDRKSVNFWLGGSNFWGNTNQVRRINYWAGTTIKPGKSFSIEISPRYSYKLDKAQYITEVELENGLKRYILGSIDQNTLSLQVRLNYSLTPKISVQYYGQPFISSGKYDDLKMVTNSLAENVQDRFYTFVDNEVTRNTDDAIYSISEQETGYSYIIDDPEYRFIQFRSNLIARWEFLPGSTIYLVWTQEKTEADYKTEQFTVFENIQDINTIHPYNIFLIKLSYMFSR